MATTSVYFANNATTKLGINISNTDTIINVIPGTGALFPKATVDTSHFYCTILDMDGYFEIVKVILRAGDTFTVERGAEGTIPRSFPIDSIIQNRVTTQGLYDLIKPAAESAASAITLAKDANLKSDQAKADVSYLSSLSRTIALTGDVTGKTTFTNKDNITIATTVTRMDDSTALFHRQVKTTSGEMLAPVSAIYTFRMCGGGGSGGGSHAKGGIVGTSTQVTSGATVFTATGGSGGGGAGSNVATGGSYGGAGGGGAGKVGSTQLYIPKGQKIVWTIGTGGLAQTNVNTSPTGSEAGFNPSANSEYMGGVGAVGACSGSNGRIVTGTLIGGGNGGNGDINGIGYGGGGAGAGGNGNGTNYIGRGGRGGEGGANGENGSTTPTLSRNGGRGGNGVVIIEWITRV